MRGVHAGIAAGYVRQRSMDLSTLGTFTRASTAVRIDQDPTDGSAAFLSILSANQRRIATFGGVPPSLHMEGRRKNWITNNQDHATAGLWNAGYVGVNYLANNGNGPFALGEADACICVANEYGQYHGPVDLSADPIASGYPLVHSFFARSRTGLGSQTVNYSAPEVGAGGTNHFASPVSIDESAYKRVDWTYFPTTYGALYHVPWDGRGSGLSSGSGTPDYRVSLDQMEWGMFPSTPIPTGGSAVERAGEKLVISSGDLPSWALGGFQFTWIPDHTSAEWVGLPSSGENQSQFFQFGSSPFVNSMQAYNEGQFTCTVCIDGVETSFNGPGLVWTARYTPITFTIQPGVKIRVEGVVGGPYEQDLTGGASAFPSGQDLKIGDNAGGTANECFFGRILRSRLYEIG